MELVSNQITGQGPMRMPALPAILRVLSLARGVLALIGFAVVLVVTVPATRDVIIQQADALARANQTFADGPDPAPAADGLQSGADSGPAAAITKQLSAKAAEARRERAVVAAFIARRYRVADEAAANYVATAYQAGRKFAVDPLLVLAVMAVESRYNPVAESHVGAKGLMQVLPRFHLDKLAAHGGVKALLDPDVNIEVGTQILREYLHRFGRTVTALQQYAGAMSEPTTQYANKVLAERARLEQVLDRVHGTS